MSLLTKNIHELTKEIESYNKEHHTLISYGQYVSMKEHPDIYEKLLRKHKREAKKKDIPQSWSQVLDGAHASSEAEDARDPLDIRDLGYSMPRVGDIVYKVPSNLIEYDANIRAKNPIPQKKRGVVIHSDPKKLNYVVKFEGVNCTYTCGYKVPGILEIDGVSY